MRKKILIISTGVLSAYLSKFLLSKKYEVYVTSRKLKKQYKNFSNLKIQKQVFPGMQGGPLMHTIAAKGVAFKEALSPMFTIYQKKVIKNAKVMAKTFVLRDIDIVLNNTKNHLILKGLIQKNPKI